MTSATIRPCCSLCGYSAWRETLIGRDRRFADPEEFVVVLCRVCGMAWQCGRPPPAAGSAHYEMPYESGRAGLAYRAFAAVVNASRARYLSRLKTHGTPLDVGRGEGEYLLQARRRGSFVMGTEASSAALRLARNRVGEAATLEPLAALPAADCDSVTLRHVLEHIADPRGVLVEARRVLRTEGALVVEVPTLDNRVFEVFQTHYFLLDLPRHQCFNNRSTLLALLRNTGFQIAHVQSPSWHFPESIFMSTVNLLAAHFGPHTKVANVLALALALPVAAVTALHLLTEWTVSRPEIICVVATKPNEDRVDEH